MASTIYALSSGSVPSGVAVIRVSGPSCRDILSDICGAVPKPRKAVLRTIRDRNQQIVDQGLVLFFPGPASFTGQDCAELHLHGSRAVISRVLALLPDYPDTRAAEPGEFTRLAMEAGKIDLLEVEGLADLLGAETEMQRRLAVEHAQGHLSSLYAAWMDRLTHARAMIEAELDFADEDDVPGSVSDRIWADMEKLADELDAHLAMGRIGEIIRDGLKVVLLGEPNAGKSSLLNVLARRDVAIVTPIPGTTRDILSVDLDLEGFSVTLVDTAGLRETGDVIEAEGIRRAMDAARTADIILHLRAPGNSTESLPDTGGARLIRVATKSDLDSVEKPSDYDIAISALSGEGIDQLLSLLLTDLREVQERNSLAIPSRIRHVSLLQEMVQALREALRGPQSDLVLRAEYLRLASHRLGRITGQVDTEGLLDIIFSSFCIGK